MKTTRPLLLVASATLVALLLGGGLAVKVGASESSYGDVVTFSEILSLVLDNYVDPVDPQHLLEGAYEGMLAGLDPNGAYLTPAEVSEWKSRADKSEGAGPGVSVLKGGRALQVVAVDEGSAAAEAGVKVGDHVRSVDGRNVRDLSLPQAWHLLYGEPGTSVTLDLVHPAEGFSRKSMTLVRSVRRVTPYRLEVRRGIAVLQLFDMQRLDLKELTTELADVRSRGIDSLLIDLRNLADLRPRAAPAVAALFESGSVLRLRERGGRLVETIERPPTVERGWSGSIAVLVNGATAGSGEALASLLQSGGQVRILGEPTYGLGAEVKLFELEDGSGLLVSAALWETATGQGWNGEGVQPDEEIAGRGSDYAAVAADQLERALELLERRDDDTAPTAEAA